jgi:4-alpha-glucanotransferase
LSLRALTIPTPARDGSRERTIPRIRNFSTKYLGRKVQEEANWEFLKIAMSSVAKTAIFPMQDILGLGEGARMNTPGKPSGNWLWRFEADQITEPLKSRLA